jgi:hypothetical protein
VWRASAKLLVVPRWEALLVCKSAGRELACLPAWMLAVQESACLLVALLPLARQKRSSPGEPNSPVDYSL